ncbi:nuclear transport factor 2 family protein [Acidicapsa dinghuensis]|uniref:Nuclear transport factor 2 family protein n=1 Tax=Acidicapsa dinghuensis TaxID=2218256 RepID=A0ABW1EB11_9BACT|nr:nuclear transport factor 2 family protein [Acidicapsa dinghuensis]
MRIRRLVWLALIAVLTVPAWSQGAKTADDKAGDKAAIHAVMEAQVAAWNRGDVTDFMKSYEDSPETTFVGAASVNKGFQPILSRYKANYSTKEQMGKLTFKDTEIRLLPTSTGVVEYAIVTGKFHLERTAKGAQTKDDGIFSLVWRKGPDGWKIVLDHTA